MTESNIKTGWKSSGLHPFNPTQVIHRLIDPSRLAAELPRIPLALISINDCDPATRNLFTFVMADNMFAQGSDESNDRCRGSKGS